ncbi:LamG-like jellyroll fold domain-containing protein [Wenyingzhuangia sp. 1_MG-2023]|nr:LamG-like jellyroll fold domain-containing protein [Wenyingzhuangia sp. 1_MG-2023]
MKKKTTLMRIVSFVTVLSLTGHSAKAQTPIAYYKFDNSLNDETTNWNLVQKIGFSATLTYEEGFDGTTNGAVSGFDTADYLETTSNFSISGNQSRTMTVWIKTSAEATQVVAGLGSSATAARWTFGGFYKNNTPRLEVHGRGFSGTTILNDGTWHHLAAVYDNTSGTATMYVDGVFEKSVDWSATALNTTSAPLRVGNDYNGVTPNRNFEGAMDELRIYDTALTSTQIVSVYTTTLSTNNITPTTFSTYPNPVVDKLFFTGKDVESVDVYNSVGTLVASHKVTTYVDMHSFSQGIYFITFKNSKGKDIKTTKAIKL